MLARTFKLLSASAVKPSTAKQLSRSFAHRVDMVLKEDVEKLGNRGDEVSVKAGYARNFLYPQKLAVYATDANREAYKVDKESVDEAEATKQRELKRIMDRLSDAEVVFKRHTASKTERKLHNQVTAENIADMLEKQHNLIVGVARINIPTPINTLGTHTVRVRVDDEIENEVAEETPSEVEEEESSKAGPSKKKEVKLSVLVERR